MSMSVLREEDPEERGVKNQTQKWAMRTQKWGISVMVAGSWFGGDSGKEAGWA